MKHLTIKHLGMQLGRFFNLIFYTFHDKEIFLFPKLVVTHRLINAGLSAHTSILVLHSVITFIFLMAHTIL
jgi:hypothetical protein